MNNEIESAKDQLTADAPPPGTPTHLLNMLGKEYRATASASHVEFSPTSADDEPVSEDGITWIDGMKRMDVLKHKDGSDLFIASAMYRKRIGTDAEGNGIYFVGDYIGNRRVIMHNESDPEVVGSTWHIYLQEEPDMDTPIVCFLLSDLEVVKGVGTRMIKANDYEPKKLGMTMTQHLMAPEKPNLGSQVEHPDHGGGVVVRVTGTGDVWYASVVYQWPDTTVAPTAGYGVRRAMPAPNNDFYYVYGDVDEVEGDKVTVIFENGRGHDFTVEGFYAEFSRCGEVSSHNFYELFNLEPGPRTLTPVFRSNARDVRTHNQRAMASASRSTVAFSAIISRNTPDSGHFVRDSAEREWSPDISNRFRWHRERQEAPKNEDFAPLTGRSKVTAKAKKGWSYDRLNEARARLDEGPDEEQLCRAYEAEPCSDGPLRPYLPCEAQLFEAIEANGSILSF